MEITLNIMFFLLGGLIVFVYFTRRSYDSLKKKYDQKVKDYNFLKKSKAEKYSQENFDELKNTYQKGINELESQNKKLKSSVNNLDRENIKMKKYIGLVGDKEYGIIVRNLKYGNDNKPLEVETSFKVLERGKNKVKISVSTEDMKTNPNEQNNHELIRNIKKYIDGWYGINDENITWIEPDDVARREFNIDTILDE